MRHDPRDRAAAIVLAAGDSRRFGSPKLLMPFGTSTIIGRVVASLQAAALDPIIVVAGAHAQAIARTLSDTPARVVTNPDPSRGMLSSLHIGISALPHDLERFLVALGDQPLISPQHIDLIIQRHLASGKGIALPIHQGKRGHPVAFHSTYRDKILALHHTQSVRDLIHSHPHDIVEVEVASDAVLRDIDTPEQYQNELPLADR